MSRAALLLLGLSALAPVALHWWTRTRPRRLRFAAWRFLPQPDAESPRRRRFEEPWLLILRAAALLALGLAAAGPGCLRPGDSAAELLGLDRPLALVDLSASMGLGANGDRPLDRAAQRLTGLFATGRAAHAGILGCRSDGVVRLLAADELAQGSLLARIERELTAGTVDWAACLQGLADDADLIVVSDQPAPTGADDWPGMSVRWLGVGRSDPTGNAAVGPLELSGERDLLRLSGSVVGDRPVSSVRIEWLTPRRPPVDLALENGHFTVELLAPSELGQLVVRTEAGDIFAGDDAVPVWIPRSELPRVLLQGAFPPTVEHRLLALLFSAGERLRVGDDADAAGERHIRVVWRPEQLPAAARAELAAAVRGGATLIAFPGASASAGPVDGELVPGWVHESQPAATPRVVPTPRLTARLSALRDLPWRTLEVRRVRPLAEPLPGAEVHLEVAGGLPVLVRHPLGAGQVWTWLVDPDPEWGNLATTAVWAPLWLALFDVLDLRAAAAELEAAPPRPRAELRRVQALWDDGAAGRWIGWWQGRDREGRPLLVSTRFDPAEATVGAALDLQVLRSGPSGAAEAPPVRHDRTLLVLLVAVMLWIAHLVYGVLRSRRLRGVVAMVCAMVGIGAAAPSWAQELPMRLVVPQESAPSAGQLAGLADLLRVTAQRTSLSFAPEPFLFSWSTSEPAAPLVWWAGCRPPELSAQPALAAKIATFLRAHGSLIVEACGGAAEVERVRTRLSEDLAGLGFVEPLTTLGRGHVLFRTFFLLDEWVDPDMVGTLYGQRMWNQEHVLLIPNLVRGLSRDAVGGYAVSMPPEARELVRRQGINLLMYAATWDYKNDAIHLPFILQRRQRQR